MIVSHIAALDVGFENPLFACLEVNYEDCDQDPTGEAYRQLQQTLTFYELDLGVPCCACACVCSDWIVFLSCTLHQASTTSFAKRASLWKRLAISSLACRGAGGLCVETWCVWVDSCSQRSHQ